MNFSGTCEWQPHKSMVGVHVTTEGDRGFLDLCFQVNGKPIAQTFELAGSVMRVGGVRWTVKCPESGKMVRDLYFVLRPDHTRFRSRHALGLSYRTSYLKPKERYGERAWKLMDRLGATKWREPPIRPKYMQRRTFRRLKGELGEAGLRDLSANLGVKTRCRYRPPPKAPQVVESMNVIAGDPHLILLYPPRNMRESAGRGGLGCHAPALPHAWWWARIGRSPRQQEHALKHGLYTRGAIEERRNCSR